MNILQLSNGRLSLELGDIQPATLLEKLGAIREVRIDEAADLLVIHTPLGRLLLVDEWDEAALISTTIEGDLLIEVLAAGLTLPLEGRRREPAWKSNVTAG